MTVHMHVVGFEISDKTS